MHISNNSSSTALSCWKKYYWRYVEELTPIRQSSSITLGKIIHDAFDLYYKGTDKIKIIDIMVSTFDEELASCGPEEQEYIAINKYIATGMFVNYPFYITDFEDIKSEMEFSIPLLNGNRFCKGISFEGRVDGLVKKNGQWWLRELKTTSQTSRMFSQRINTSSQGTGYVWAMRKLGYPVVGIMYDYIKRPLLRKRVSEDQHDFGFRILEDYRSKPEAYFNQVYSYRNDTELAIWERDTKNHAKDIRKKLKTGEFYRNTGSCFNWNSECPYYKICFQDRPDPLMLQLYFLKGGKSIAGAPPPEKDYINTNIKASK